MNLHYLCLLFNNEIVIIRKLLYYRILTEKISRRLIHISVTDNGSLCVY